MYCSGVFLCGEELKALKSDLAKRVKKHFGYIPKEFIFEGKKYVQNVVPKAEDVK